MKVYVEVEIFLEKIEKKLRDFVDEMISNYCS